jgi:hypothetical protein
LQAYDAADVYLVRHNILETNSRIGSIIVGWYYLADAGYMEQQEYMMLTEIQGTIWKTLGA